MVLYHVTDEVNLLNIMMRGLVPMTGMLSDIALEPLSAVYFFKELDEAFDKDINGWMTLRYDRNKMALLKVTLPDDFDGLRERWDWEVLSYNRIPPEYIERIPFPKEH